MSRYKWDMNEEQWEQFRHVWESYGVKFQNDDGSYKCLYDVLKQMASIWNKMEQTKRGDVNETTTK